MASSDAYSQAMPVGLIIAVAVGALLLIGLSYSPGALDDSNAIGHGVYLVALLAFLASGLGYHYRQKGGQAVKHLSIWAVILLIFIIGFSFREEVTPAFKRIQGELLPANAMTTASGETMLRRNMSGHFAAMTYVNGNRIRMMVDTGASRVVLTADDAKRAGISLNDLNFTQIVSTANGQAVTAPVTLDSVKINDIVLHDVKASVAQPDRLSTSLLGMSFLSRLDRMEFSGDTLTLQQ
jgi:aspartyl protease family protein